MSEQALTRLVLAVLLLTCAGLLWLDWRRHQELEHLHLRLDRLDPPGTLPRQRPRPPATAAPFGPTDPPPAADPVPGSVPLLEPDLAGPAQPEVHPLVAAVIAARSDRELSELGESGR